MQEIQIKFPIIITKLESHNRIKNTLLDLIDAESSSVINDSNDRISRTDWDINDMRLRNYMLYLQESLGPCMQEVYDRLNYPNFKIHNHWFQQYRTNDTHDWHRHETTFWANVYYLELPKGTPPTIFLDPLDSSKTIVPEVEEGDIITFPSILLHCSPQNLSSSRKTVIAFNVI
jgi:hypothetical protein